MSSRVRIDLNVRVRGNQTYVGLEDAEGPIAVGDQVVVFEPESGLEGSGCIVEIDSEAHLVYLSVDWGSLRAAVSSSPVHPALADKYRIVFRAASAVAVTTGGGGIHQQLVTVSPVSSAA